jgi:hypothetical protein
MTTRTPTRHGRSSTRRADRHGRRPQLLVAEALVHHETLSEPQRAPHAQFTPRRGAAPGPDDLLRRLLKVAGVRQLLSVSTRGLRTLSYSFQERSTSVRAMTGVYTAWAPLVHRDADVRTVMRPLRGALKCSPINPKSCTPPRRSPPSSSQSTIQRPRSASKPNRPST